MIGDSWHVASSGKHVVPVGGHVPSAAGSLQLEGGGVVDGRGMHTLELLAACDVPSAYALTVER